MSAQAGADQSLSSWFSHLHDVLELGTFRRPRSQREPAPSELCPTTCCGAFEAVAKVWDDGRGDLDGSHGIDFGGCDTRRETGAPLLAVGSDGTCAVDYVDSSGMFFSNPHRVGTFKLPTGEHSGLYEVEVDLRGRLGSLTEGPPAPAPFPKHTHTHTQPHAYRLSVIRKLWPGC